MSKVTIREWYERVEALWGPQMPLPKLTAQEAIKAARKLWRFGHRKTWTGPIKLSSGNRYTWIRRGILVINPDRGWHSLVHDLSHETLYNTQTGARPHGSVHARIEMRMIKEVIKRGWLSGSLIRPHKPQPSKSEQHTAKFLRVETAIVRWERKLKRAQTALKKLERQLRYYARSQAQLPVTLQ